jgi:hypothetical protein
MQGQKMMSTMYRGRIGGNVYDEGQDVTTNLEDGWLVS